MRLQQFYSSSKLFPKSIFFKFDFFRHVCINIKVMSLCIHIIIANCLNVLLLFSFKRSTSLCNCTSIAQHHIAFLDRLSIVYHSTYHFTKAFQILFEINMLLQNDMRPEFTGDNIPISLDLLATIAILLWHDDIQP